MGVWECGPLLEAEYADSVPSPYAITSYRVPANLGGDSGLSTFRARLHEHGLKLLLDFVPNHTSRAHEWVERFPRRYVHDERPRPDCFRAGALWVAHGKDPYFPAWIDTAQLDYRNPEARSAMITEMLGVAAKCDGVRCDMSMLLLNHVFAQTWKEFQSSHPEPRTEFWSEAIARVRHAQPDFLLLAEAYWDLEEQLLDVGFNYAYDKRIYDHLIARNPQALLNHLRSKNSAFLSRTMHFLENHDEPRIASLMSFEEHRAASLLTMALPGMRLLHELQTTGATIRASIHRLQRPAEPVQQMIAAWYEDLLDALRNSAVGRGGFELLHETSQAVIGLTWTNGSDRFDLVAVNLAEAAGTMVLPLQGGPWKAVPALPREGANSLDLSQGRVLLELGPFAAHFLQFRRAA